jgi:hypothetical protein
MVPAAQEQLGRLIGHRLKQRKIRRQAEAVRFHRPEPDVAGEMSHGPRHEERRLAQGDNAVDKHVPALAVDQRDRQPLLEILARRHPVKAILGEEIGPALELAFVESVGVSAVEIGKTRP